MGMIMIETCFNQKKNHKKKQQKKSNIQTNKQTNKHINKETSKQKLTNVTAAPFVQHKVCTKLVGVDLTLFKGTFHIVKMKPMK